MSGVASIQIRERFGLGSKYEAGTWWGSPAISMSVGYCTPVTFSEDALESIQLFYVQQSVQRKRQAPKTANPPRPRGSLHNPRNVHEGLC
jgi:hypothetical protein